MYHQSSIIPVHPGTSFVALHAFSNNYITSYKFNRYSMDKRIHF